MKCRPAPRSEASARWRIFGSSWALRAATNFRENLYYVVG